jgi:hypothetical protein
LLDLAASVPNTKVPATRIEAPRKAAASPP